MNPTSHQLDHYSFVWSEARLLIAALALFLGGKPPVLAFNPLPGLYGSISLLLTLAWIISGIASTYLLYRWYTQGRKLFGHEDTQDHIAFFIMTISGFNLGITGLLGVNIGMSFTTNSFIFILTGMLYLAAALYLFNRWSRAGKELF